MATTTMRTHSYASDASSGSSAWQWLVFAQQKKADAFTLTVVVHTSANGDAEEPHNGAGKRALYELQLDELGLCRHVRYVVVAAVIPGVCM